MATERIGASNLRREHPSVSKETPQVGASSRRSVRVFTDPLDVWALRPAWDALWRRADGSYAQASASCAAAWRHVAERPGVRLHVVACFEGNVLVAIWPLLRRRNAVWRVLSQLSSMAAEFSDILAEDDPARDARVAAIWQCVRTQGRADMIMLPFVKATTPLGTLLAAGDFACTAEPDIAPYVAWQKRDSWEQYYATLSASGRKVQKKKWRQLHAMGELRFEVVRDPQRLTGLIRWLMQQKRIWAGRAGKHGPWLASSQYERFLVQLATEPDVGAGFMFLLTLDGEPIAGQFAMEGERHIDWVIAGFSAAMASHSPGMVLNEYCLRHARDHALRVEMGAGREHNKLFWSRAEVHDTLNYRIALTRFGIPGLRVSNAKIVAVGWVKDRLRRYRRKPAAGEAEQPLA